MDCQTDPEENVRAAVERGLTGITFTEHFDLHPHERGECIYDHEPYREAIGRLHGAYGSGMHVGLGIEVGYFADGLGPIAAFLAGKAFDLVIMSFHYMDDRPLHLSEGWEGLDALTATRRYLSGVAEGLTACRLAFGGRGPFNVLGHLDLAKRYSHRMFGVTVVDQCAAEIDRVLTLCLELDIVPEINTSTIRQGVGHAMPDAAVVRRYAELGGRAMSIGSDAHRAADIGADFDRAATMLRDAGLCEARFRHGEAEFHPVALPPRPTAPSGGPAGDAEARP